MSCRSLFRGIPAAALFLASGASAGDIHPTVFQALQEGGGRAAVWVFFADKGLSGALLDAAIAELESTYDQHSVQRRPCGAPTRGFSMRDLPIESHYRAAVLATGASGRVESRWANAVSVSATLDQVNAIAALPFVSLVQPVAHSRSCRPLDFTPLPVQPYGERGFYGIAEAQLAQMNLIALHNRGFTGRGVVVGILDTGFSRIHNAFNNPAHPTRIIAEHDFINNDGNTGIEAGDPGDQHTHGTLILSCLGSYLPDQMVGGAYDASFVLCKTEVVPSETPIEEDYYAAGVEFIEAHGGDMTTSSLGYIDWYTQADLNGARAVTTIALNTAAANGVHCCTAAGNEGHDEDPATSHLLAPADALHVLACGAADINGVEAGFSSDGPTADGRLKPEVMACGVGTACVNPYTPDTFASASGTSLSTPMVASTVACLIQAHPDWTVDRMRTALFSTASDQAANGHPDALFVRGYGIVNALAAHLTACPADFNHDGGVDGGDVEAFFVSWESGDAPADVNADGGVDGADVEVFFVAWANGGC